MKRRHGRCNCAPLVQSPRVLACLLVTLSAPGVAIAEPAASGGPPRLVSLGLRGDEVDLRVELSPDVEEAQPVAVCVAPCRVQVPPGWYRVRVSGRHPDIEGDFSWLQVERDGEVLLRTPWESRKQRGRRAGIAGAVVSVGGLSVTALGLYVTMLVNALSTIDYVDLYGDDEDLEDPDYGSSEEEPDQTDWVSPLVPVGAGITVIGGIISAAGWRAYVRNTGPGLRSLASGRTRPRASRTSWLVTPAPVGHGLGVLVGARF